MSRMRVDLRVPVDKPAPIPVGIGTRRYGYPLCGVVDGCGFSSPHAESSLSVLYDMLDDQGRV
jgi:hypothetical protein